MTDGLAELEDAVGTSHNVLALPVGVCRKIWLLTVLPLFLLVGAGLYRGPDDRFTRGIPRAEDSVDEHRGLARYTAAAEASASWSLDVPAHRGGAGLGNLPSNSKRLRGSIASLAGQSLGFHKVPSVTRSYTPFR